MFDSLQQDSKCTPRIELNSFVTMATYCVSDLPRIKGISGHQPRGLLQYGGGRRKTLALASHFHICKWCLIYMIQRAYTSQDIPVQRTDAQKDLGILVCKDWKWNCHVLAAASKANRMLSFIRRSTLEIKIQPTRKALYTVLVMSNLSYSSQVWAPQSVKLIEIIERVQRRATKYILSLPYRTNISYKERLRRTELIPLCYWHEYLDLVYTYKSIVNNTDPQFKTSKPVRVTRRTASSKSVLLDIPKAKTVTFQNSFYSRASRAFNTLPEHMRDNTQSINVFKTNLRKHYLNLTLTVYDPAVPQTFKSVCVKCHTSRPLTALLVKLCC